MIDTKTKIAVIDELILDTKTERRYWVVASQKGHLDKTDRAFYAEARRRCGITMAYLESIRERLGALLKTEARQ
jgi:hypothetical protein